MEIVVILFVIAVLLAVITLLHLFLRGIFSLLPGRIQDAIRRTSAAIESIGRMFSIVIFPFIGAYLGFQFGTGWGIAGLIVGGFIGLGVRDKLHNSVANENGSEGEIKQSKFTATNIQQSSADDGKAEYEAADSISMLLKHDEARSLLKIAVQKAPKPKYLKALGAREQMLGNPSEALVCYSRAIDAEPKTAGVDSLYALRASVKHEQLSDSNGAIMDYTQAITMDPEVVHYYGERAQVFAALNDFDNAISDFSHAISLDPTKEEWFGRRGVVYMTIGKPQEAISDFNSASKLDPEGITEDWKNAISQAAQQL